jgi:hypothetical protein
MEMRKPSKPRTQSTKKLSLSLVYWPALVGVCFACDGGFFELEMPKLMRKKRRPLRSEARMDMEVWL